MLVALNYGMKLINFFSVQAFESLIVFKYVSKVVVGRCMHLKFFCEELGLASGVSILHNHCIFYCIRVHVACNVECFIIWIVEFVLHPI